jgi:CubicO group peptidase (beta-lactamase class C family)
MNALIRFFVALPLVAGVLAHGAESYFPPPESEGGWRTLVPANSEPSAEQKRTVREQTGLDWDKLAEAWRYTASFKTPNNLLIIRHGWIAGQWMNFTNPRGIASCTKSLTALAMARLFDMSDDGQLPKRIGLDDEAWRFLPAAWVEAEPARKQIRLRHLLTMTSGLTPYDGPYKADYLDQVFAQRVEAPQGTVWAYASVPVDMLSLILEKVSGRKLDQFFNEEINAAIGATPVKWGQFSGHAGGSGGPQGGAQFPERELARVGYLALHHGAWQTDGQRRQVISAERLDAFTHREPSLEKTTWRQPNFAFEPQANKYYGHLWWNNHTGQGLGEAAPRDAFYMSGWGKQACFVVPSLDLVVVRLGPDQKLNEHPEFYHELWRRLMAAVAETNASPPVSAPASAPTRAFPFDGQTFQGRIAWSADGNFNDEDDWGASPMALAIFARSGVADKLVHFDYNSILYDNNPEWAKLHETNVLGAAERFGFRREVFFDCQKNLDAAVNSIAAAVNASSLDDPLWFVIAGPMEVPLAGLRKADPAKLPFVHCISHNRWNDGFDAKSGSRFKFNKRDIIPLGVHWVQIRDQNEFLSTSRYGAPARDADWQPWLWLRDSSDGDGQFLWDCLRSVTRTDCSDAGMARLLMTGDEENTIAKLRELVEARRVVTPIAQRQKIRLEAENFHEFDGVEVEYKNDRRVSQRLNVKLIAGRKTGRIATPFVEPYTADEARYDIEVRYFTTTDGVARLSFLVNGSPVGPQWQAPSRNDAWLSHIIPSVVLRRGDHFAITLETNGDSARLDYVELKRR